MDKTIYIGIDPSLSNTGIVVLDGHKIYSYEYKTPKVDGDDAGELRRLDRACGNGWKWLEGFTKYGDFGAFDVGIEVPMGRHQGAAVKVDRLFGYWVGAIQEHCHKLRSYTPGQIKLFFTGSGSCHIPRMKNMSKYQKEMMVWFANNVWDFKTDSHDIADAFAIAKLTQYIDEDLYEL